MQPTKRYPSGIDVEDHEHLTKRIRQDPLFLLPPEVWELIFRNLNACWLRSARLTCSTWNRIIRGSSRLMDRFVLFLSKDDFCGEGRKYVRKLLADGGGYTRAKFLFAGIGQSKPRIGWLTPLGTTLHTLSVYLSCTHVFLAQLLKETPNLKQFNIRLNTNASFRNVVPDFRLEKLEGLRINCYPCRNVVSFLSYICPRLRVLKVDQWIDHELAPEIIKLIRKNRGTLEELKYKAASKCFLEELATTDNLRLKRIIIKSSEQSIVEFLKEQTELEQLELPLWTLNSNSTELIASLPNLKALKTKVNRTDRQFLQCLSSIEKLSLEFVELRDVNFDSRDFKLSKLRSLELNNCYLTYIDLWYIQETHITTLVLEDCRVFQLSYLRLLQTLNHLELKSIRSSDVDLDRSDEQEDYSSSLVSLKLSYIDPERMLDLAEQFSSVKQLNVGDGVLDEASLQALIEHFQLLEELHFSGIHTPADYWLLENALTNFTALKLLVVRCNSLAEKASIAEALRGFRQDVAIELHVELFD